VDSWVLPTLSELLTHGELVMGQPFPNSPWVSPHSGNTKPNPHSSDHQAVHQWHGAVAAMNGLLQNLENTNPSPYLQGMVISGSLPVLTHSETSIHYSSWLFNPAPTDTNYGLTPQLLPGASCNIVTVDNPVLSLLPMDPLTKEQFCLLLTPQFSLVLVLGWEHTERLQFQFSFAPEVVEAAWKALRSRVVLTAPHYLSKWDKLWDQFPPMSPDYQWVMQFSRLLLGYLSNPPSLVKDNRTLNSIHQTPEVIHPFSPTDQVTNIGDSQPFAVSMDGNHNLAASLSHIPKDDQPVDVELLQAIAHEVRTPLATIRTLTRLLLKRRTLPSDLLPHLEAIDRECTEQINRFSLIFRAAELETSELKQPVVPLMPMSVAQVFQQCIPHWQQQCGQRRHTLEVILPPKMPKVVSDPTMLDQVLTSLIERFTRNFPSGSHIQVKVVYAGNQLKLQLQANPVQQLNYSESDHPQDGGIAPKENTFRPSLKSLGQLLMFQPETGSLSLKLSVTKNLFQALGAKLIVRQRPNESEILTIFLPLE